MMTAAGTARTFRAVLSALALVHFVGISLAATPACPTYGQCSIQIDEDTCLFMSLKPQILFSNDVCAEVPNGTLYAFMLPVGYKYYFYPPTLFYPHTGYCPYFNRAERRLYRTHKYRNAWLIVGAETENKTSSVEIIRLDLQHAVTNETTEIRYRKTEATFEPIGEYTVIANYTVMKEVYARNPSKDNPLAILVYLWDNLKPQHEWQHVRTLKELHEVDVNDSLSINRVSRATCVFPSLRQLCMSFNEKTGECTCQPGFIGTFCEKDIDECHIAPCKHGTCVNTRGSYFCTCEEGWTGRHCDEDVNECNYPNICGPSGTCENTLGSFLCHCPAGLTGKHCDVDVEECSQHPNPCEPGGKCVETFGSYVCHCLPGWTGTHCESDVDECTSNEDACFNGGTCINTIGSYTCQCSRKWTGSRCQESIDECAKLKCVNGLCRAKGSTDEVECRCYMGWSGDDCSVDRDECLENEHLCLNNGLCVDPKGNYSCVCSPGYTGKNCEADINECSIAACVNGYCFDLVNNYKCECYPRWTGANCNVELSPCSFVNFKCGKGTCLADGGIPRCVCPLGYTGAHCEITISQCEAAPCQNGGVCADGERANEFECICPENYGGLDCSIYSNPCVPSPCQNGASCIINGTSPYGFTCLCRKGFHGGICESREGFHIVAPKSAGFPTWRRSLQVTIAALILPSLIH